MEPFAEPIRVAGHMQGLRRPWFIAGGWAIDLFLGRLTRKHADIEVAVLRADQHRVMRHLNGWTFRKVLPHKEHQMEPWSGLEWLGPPIHEIHASHGSEPFDTMEILLNEADDEDWSFRRNPAVTCPLSRMGLIATPAIPILSPEIVLLFKAAAPREKDHVDFENIVGSLEPERRAWLKQALVTCYSNGRPWMCKL